MFETEHVLRHWIMIMLAGFYTDSRFKSIYSYYTEYLLAEIQECRSSSCIEQNTV